MNTGRFILGLLLFQMTATSYADSPAELLRDARFAFTTAVHTAAGTDCEGISSRIRNAMAEIQELGSACTQESTLDSPPAFVGHECVEWVGEEAKSVFCYDHYRECAPISELWYATANLHRRAVLACWKEKDLSENPDDLAEALQRDLDFYGNLREFTGHLSVGGSVERRIVEEAMRAIDRHHHWMLEELASIARELRDF